MASFYYTDGSLLSELHRIPLLINKYNEMKYILYIVAVVMIISWAIGFFVFAVGAIIHILLVIALIFILVKFFSGNKNK